MRKVLAAVVLALTLFVVPAGAVPTPALDVIPVVAAPVVDPDNVATFGEPKGEQLGMCPDGRMLTLGLYDPNPNDPEAVVYKFSAGNVPIALRVILDGQDRLYVYAARRWFPMAEAREQWPTPCDIPTDGR